MMASSLSRIRAAAAGPPVKSIRLPPGRRSPVRRSTWAWLVNMSNARPGVAIAYTSSQGIAVGLARLHRHAEEGAVGELLQRRGGLAGHRGDERRGERGLRRDDDVARADGVSVARVQVVDEQLVPVGAQRTHAAPRAGAVAELAAQRRGQPARAAAQVASDERALAAPDEREQADAAARRQLRRLRGGAMGRAGEDGVDGRRQRAEEVRERPVALEGEHARARRRRLARAGRASRW